MRRAGRWTGRAVAGVTGTVAVARLGVPALALVLAVIVIMATVVCWILASEQRSRNAERLIRATHPQPPLAAPSPAPAPPGPPPVTAKRWRARGRKGAEHG